jgi:hypothetical protein
MRCPWVNGKAHGKGEVWIKKTRSKEPAEWIHGDIIEK